MWRRDKFKFPPGPYRGLKGWSFRALRQNPLEMFSELARCGDIVGIRVVNFRNIVVNHPDLIEEVLVGHPRRYIKGRVLRANRHVFGEGLLTSEGDFWLRQRRLVQPGFHRARIAAYAVTMVQYAQRMLEGWRDGEERDVHQEMIRLTLQIVAKPCLTPMSRATPGTSENLLSCCSNSAPISGAPFLFHIGCP